MKGEVMSGDHIMEVLFNEDSEDDLIPVNQLAVKDLNLLRLP
jgi:hypothetical protein